VIPHGRPHPLPFQDHLGVDPAHEPTDPLDQIAAPVPQLRDQSVQVLRGCRAAHCVGGKAQPTLNTERGRPRLPPRLTGRGQSRGASPKDPRRPAYPLRQASACGGRLCPYQRFSARLRRPTMVARLAIISARAASSPREPKSPPICVRFCNSRISWSMTSPTELAGRAGRGLPRLPSDSLLESRIRHQRNVNPEG